MKKTEPKTKSATETRFSPRAAELLGLDEIKELIELVAEKQFDEFELERGSFRLRLLRGMRSAVTAPAVAIVQDSPQPTVTPAPAPSAAQQEEPLYLITSPIVGTFYGAPSPTAEPFVKIGDLVSPEQTVCIIEAMKLMNEIQSEVSGTIASIFVENGQPVEYGQPLFGIKI